MKTPITSSKKEKFLDAASFLLAAWSEFGYAAFTGAVASASLLDPMKRYLYPHISSGTADSISNKLGIFTKVLAICDASLTIATILNIGDKRRKFIQELKKGLSEISESKINKPLFLINSLLFLYSFVVIALSPWVGLLLQEIGDNNETNIAGSTMFAGQMIILSFQYAGYIFSTPSSLYDFFYLDKKGKLNILSNVFLTKKGLRVLLRSVSNIFTLGMRFYGIAIYTDKNLFKLDNPYDLLYSSGASIAVGYRILVTQSMNDYKNVFLKNEYDEKVINASNENESKDLPHATSSAKHCNSILFGLFGLLIVMVFFLRTFTTPSLYTGPIENPESDYGTKETVLGSVGLVMGGLAAFQYCKFMKTIGTDAILKGVDFFSQRFFTRKDRPEIDQIIDPLLNNQDTPVLS